MSFKSKVTAAAAALTLVGGVGMAGALTADPRRRPRRRAALACVNLFSYQFGTHNSPNYTVDVLRQGEKIGQPIILFRTANYDPALDWTVAFQGTVADFYAANLVDAETALHYGCIPAGTPGANFPTCPFSVATTGTPGKDSELPGGRERVRAVRRGVGPVPGRGRDRFQDEGVTLQPCGESANTVWILDFQDSWSTFIHGGYIPLINGSDTNFSHPYVLNYPGNGAYPTDKPRPQLTTWTLSKYSNGTVFDNQMWSADFGVLP